MNPKAYCITHNIPTTDFIKRVREVAPKYSKSTHRMASNTDYGVMLRPDVARHILGKKENRKLACQLTYRVTEGFRERLTAVKEALNLGTMQEVISFAVNRLVEDIEAEIKNAAASAGTETTAQEYNLNELYNGEGSASI